MTTHDPSDHRANNPSNGRARPAGTERPDRDLLISRVVDDAASSEDWLLLRELADSEPAIWRELFEAQHVQADLARAVDDATGIADSIDAVVEGRSPRLPPVVARAGAFAGWAVAAAVAAVALAPGLLGMAGGSAAGPGAGASAPGAGAGGSAVAMGGGGDAAPAGQPDRASRPRFERSELQPDRELMRLVGSRDDGVRPGSREPVGAQASAADALSGLPAEFAGELPDQLREMPQRVLIQARELPDGRLELIYVRRLLERAVVGKGELYQIKPDDAGIPRSVPLRQSRETSGPI